MANEQPKIYKEYDQMLASVNQAFTLAATAGDLAGVTYLLDGLDAIVHRSDDILAETYRAVGSA